MVYVVNLRGCPYREGAFAWLTQSHGFATTACSPDGNCMYDAFKQVITLTAPGTLPRRTGPALTRLREQAVHIDAAEAAEAKNQGEIVSYGGMDEFTQLCNRHNLIGLVLLQDRAAVKASNPFVVIQALHCCRGSRFFIAVLHQYGEAARNHWDLLNHKGRLVWDTREQLPNIVQQCWDTSSIVLQDNPWQGP